MSFPPLLTGEAATNGADPFVAAINAARIGTDAGLIIHDVTPENLRAAMVLAPECSLEDAMAGIFALAIGMGDALGALSPPEVAVHFEWPMGLRVNGAKCGQFRAAASHADPSAEPDWLVIGFDMPIVDYSDNPGEDPDITNLYDEGCTEIQPDRLLESWSRHALVWLNRWADEGLAPLHADWRSRAHGMGKDITINRKSGVITGTFTGLDEQGGLLLTVDGKTILVPLSEMLE